MWMTEYAREAKRQLRDVYGFTPSRMVGDDPCFDHIPDGIYPMVIDGRRDLTVVAGGAFYFMMEMKTPKAEVEMPPVDFSTLTPEERAAIETMNKNWAEIAKRRGQTNG